ncbi:TetR family transcriptional regulator C-terminal domain-containing protein [Limibaculum sp. M0105]|uniref:TetR family transcriptional regulator C-terminal domain-containing protein n=1 Tax=Thermohalobaculum xanthum TaxID=2753746 RepID=A0A8J7SEW7_9RHOB|nr:TetR family transcriptional regulator C-terminal domain-containing protein [Thermohalobaculum xanthum]MBK0399192.1 TetR family transcriptional regulator C-terminal domain-containing protein [Thermohalobaculum xanthum]
MIEATLRSVARNGLAATTLATVSKEAGLSQGVAVFYFETKERLLAAAFRHHYEIYRRNWHTAHEAAGPDPVDRLCAIVLADFDPVVFNPEATAVWHAFWGQATARPLYAEISDEYDGERARALETIAAELIAGRPAPIDAAGLAVIIDAVTDGLWLRNYLAPGWPDPAEAIRHAADAIGALFPDKADRIFAGINQPSMEQRA